jgi:glycosyltransferase involved in cell wall biosynthesis
MAGLYRRKGIGDLIAAFGQIADEFPKASVLVLGWGPDQGSFERQKTSVRGGERIHLQGFVAKPRRILREATVFVLASHTESFPLSLAEAREAGCAIVATTVGGVPELLEHGRAGLLVPPHDPKALARALRRLLGDSQELARWRKASQTNLDWLSCTRMARETVEVYDSLLRDRSGFRELDQRAG